MKGRETMKSRRDFLKDAAAGAVLLGSSATADKLALAAVLDTHAANGKSKVVVARDAALHGTSAQLDEQRVLDLLDRAMPPTPGAKSRSRRGRALCPQTYSRAK